MIQICPKCGRHFSVSEDVVRYAKDAPAGDIRAARGGKLTCPECNGKEKFI